MHPARRVVAIVVCVLIALAALGNRASGGNAKQAQSQAASSTATSVSAQDDDATSSESPAATSAAAAPASSAAASAAAASDATGAALKIHYISVGQGDSEFLELPNGQTLLIDGGPTASSGTVVAYVKSLGYARIDYVISTHPHEDHVGGLAAVLRSFEIGQIWATKETANTAAYEHFLDAASAAGGINTAKAGITLASGDDFSVVILAPQEGATFDNLNDSSVVTLVTFHDKTFLFTGDAGSSEVRAAYANHVDILKVAHHGSEDGTSASLVSALSPSFAVIEVGANNDYDLPSQVTLGLLKNVSVMRTDELGTIVATCDGDNISFNVAVPPTAAAQAAMAAASAQAAGVSATNASDGSDVTVYVTKTGKKYHADGCTWLSKSKIAMSLKDAIAAGYTPCGKCKPPTLQQ